MNRLVPYLDLFARLTDAELAKLSGASEAIVVAMRERIMQVNRRLEDHLDLLPRLNNDELARLTGLSPRTILFWRRCQPTLELRKRPELLAPPRPGPGGASNDAHIAVPSPPVPEPAPAVTPEVAAVPEAVPAPASPAPEAGEPGAPKVLQRAVSSMMSISGDPFPDYNKRNAEQTEEPETGGILAPLDSITNEEVELNLEKMETLHGQLNLSELESENE